MENKARPVIYGDLCFRPPWTVFCGGLPSPKTATIYKTPSGFLGTNHPPTAHAYLIVRLSLLHTLCSKLINGIASATGYIDAMATGIQITGETATVVPPQGSHPPDISTPLIKFPPFPEIPEGVSIIPFSQFPAKGIKKRLVPDHDHPDLDGHGRPTVRLKVAHTSTSSKKKKRLGEGDDGIVRKYVWYEEWAKDEDARKTSVD